MMSVIPDVASIMDVDFALFAEETKCWSWFCHEDFGECFIICFLPVCLVHYLGRFLGHIDEKVGCESDG